MEILTKEKKMKKYLVLAVLTALAIGISLYNPPVSVQAQGQSDQARQLKTLCHFDNSIDDFGHVLLLPCKSLAEHLRENSVSISIRATRLPHALPTRLLSST